MITKIAFFIVLIYLAAGFLFALLFVTRGVDRIDEGAHGGSWGFRLMIIPGTIVLWPVLLKKWINAKADKHDQGAS